MPKLPTIRGKALIKILERLGFSVIRVKGSHHYLSHFDGRATVIPVHSGEDIGTGLLLKILKDCELNREEFIKLVK